jgi:hypothetical protein
MELVDSATLFMSDPAFTAAHITKAALDRHFRGGDEEKAVNSEFVDIALDVSRP